MRIQPCINCHRRPSCERYAATLKAVRGSGLTAGKLRCDAWAEDFPPGRRVSFLATSYDDSEGYSRACQESRSGTVLAIGRKSCALIVLDEPIQLARGAETNFVPVTSDRLSRLDEPDRALCRDCARPLRLDGSHDGPDDENPCWKPPEADASYPDDEAPF